MKKKLSRKKIIALVLTCIVLFCIVLPPIYIKYQSETSCDLTYFAFRSVRNELEECVDYFTSAANEAMGECYADYYIRIIRTDENQYTLYLWHPYEEEAMQEIKVVTDSTGKIWNNIKKIEEAFNKNAFEIFFSPSLLGFSEFEIINNEFNFRYLFDGEAGLKGIACSLDGHKPKSYLENGFIYYRLAKNWYGIRKEPFWTPNQEGISQVEVIIPE